MKIGSIEEARAIAGHEGETPPPKGWNKIGQGASRTAYRAPSGIVYKTPHWEDDYANHMEVKLSRKLSRRMHSNWRFDVSIPSVTGWSVDNVLINAMPYLPTEKKVICKSYDGYNYWTDKPCSCRKFGEPHTCFALVWEYLEEQLGLQDVWEGNLSFNNGLIHVIDLGDYS